MVQVMSCRLLGTKPLSKPVLGYCQLDPKEQISVKFQPNYQTVHSRNASENIVCEMVAILSRGDELIDIYNGLQHLDGRVPIIDDRVM